MMFLTPGRGNFLGRPLDISGPLDDERSLLLSFLVVDLMANMLEIDRGRG